MKKNVLKKLSNQTISPEIAYEKLYPKKPLKKARFVKIRIQVNDQKVVSGILNTLFILPFPIRILKIGKRFAPEEMRFSFDYIDYAKGTLIDIDTKDAKIFIKVI